MGDYHKLLLRDEHFIRSLKGIIFKRALSAQSMYNQIYENSFQYGLFQSCTLYDEVLANNGIVIEISTLIEENWRSHTARRYSFT